MSAWAIVPVKPFSEGKSRLRACFSPNHLLEINRKCFFRTLKTLQACSEINQVLVVSRSDEVLSLALGYGAEALMEEPPYSLNNGISQALAYLTEKDCSKILIIPTDLPRLEVDDLHQLLNHTKQSSTIRLVPDNFQTGTNAVLLTKGFDFEPQFGRNSFQKHSRQALKLSGKLEVLLLENIQHDLDTYADLKMLDEDILKQFELRI